MFAQDNKVGRVGAWPQLTLLLSMISRRRGSRFAPKEFILIISSATKSPNDGRAIILPRCSTGSERMRDMPLFQKHCTGWNWRWPVQSPLHLNKQTSIVATGRSAVPIAEVAVHSITSSALARSVGGSSMSSNLAVCKLITSSNLVDCTTGRSAGLAPLRMRPA